MKKIIFALTATLFLASCGNTPKETTETAEATSVEVFGEGLSEASVISIGQLKEKLAEATANAPAVEETASVESEEVEEKKIFVQAKLTGEVKKVCKKMGCWMKVNTDGEEIMVTFKDYKFFVPKDCDGKKTTVEGVAYYELMPVEDLQHLAEDAGKTKEEIAQITEPKMVLKFEAQGVELKSL